jgi:endonuclease YncB( thermonuclease family)
VYDADTLTIASRLPYPESPLYRFQVWLNGIDTPEMKGLSEDEWKCAKEAQQFVKELLLGKKIVLKNAKKEKYGWILADVWYGDSY